MIQLRERERWVCKANKNRRPGVYSSNVTFTHMQKLPNGLREDDDADIEDHTRDQETWGPRERTEERIQTHPSPSGSANYNADQPRR